VVWPWLRWVIGLMMLTSEDVSGPSNPSGSSGCIHHREWSPRARAVTKKTTIWRHFVAVLGVFNVSLQIHKDMIAATHLEILA